MIPSTFADRSRDRLRSEVLDAASAEIAARGWPKVRMQTLADAVGVSRRTLYNEFGNKLQLAQALVTRSVERLGDLASAAVEGADDLSVAWRETTSVALRAADADPVIVAMRAETAGPDFLPLLTSEGDPAIAHLTGRIAGALRARWPDLGSQEAHLASHMGVRLIISFFLRAPEGHEAAADQVSELLSSYLAQSAGAGAYAASTRR